MGQTQARGTDLETLLANHDAYETPQTVAKFAASQQRPTALFVPGLAARPWWEEPQLGEGAARWAAALRAAWKEIAAECQALRAAVPGPASTQWPRWNLLEEGAWVEELCGRCPTTAALLKAVPLCDSALGYAYFSVLPPGAHVGSHCGVSNAKLRCHLALSVPPGGGSGAACAISVAGRQRSWQQGELLLFDDSFVHEVWNKRSEERVVLLFDIWHPQLAAGDVLQLRRRFPPIPPPEKLAAASSSQGGGGGSAKPPASLVRVVSTSSAAAAAARKDLSARLGCREGLEQLLLSHLPVGDVASIATASAHWRKVAMSESVWAQMLQRDHQEKTAQSYVAYRDLYPKLVRIDRKEQYDFTLRFVMLGDPSVGKTSFLTRLADDQFSEHYMATIGIDFKILTLRCQGVNVKLQMWDTAGPERFRTVTRAYYRNAAGIFLMYDQSQRRTFEAMQKWHSQARDGAPDSCHFLMVALKSDLEPQVSAEEGKALAKELNMPWVQVSSKEPRNVERAAAQLLKRAVAAAVLAQESAASGTVQPPRPRGGRKPLWPPACMTQ